MIIDFDYSRQDKTADIEKDDNLDNEDMVYILCIVPVSGKFN